MDIVSYEVLVGNAEEIEVPQVKPPTVGGTTGRFIKPYLNPVYKYTGSW